jgi:uncharacterized protein with HEPN domain
MFRPRSAAAAILHLIDLIGMQTAELAFDHFASDRDIQDATAYRLLAIGEHVRLLPDAVKERFPELPWRLMIGMRNLFAHDYFGVVAQELWDTVTNDLPLLEAACREIESDTKP